MENKAAPNAYRVHACPKFFYLSDYKVIVSIFFKLSQLSLKSLTTLGLAVGAKNIGCI